MPTALQGFRENNRERRGVGPPCQHSRAFSASGKGLKRWPLILSPTLRRRTDLGFTRDRHINYASRLRPSVQCCQVPRRGGSGLPPEGPPVGGTRKTTSMLS